MFRPLRTAISAVVLGLGLWAAFAIDLGGKSFAEHVDTISETPAAQELIDGTRATINPALSEVRDRVLGEYVEAPTWIPEGETVLSSTHVDHQADDDDELDVSAGPIYAEPDGAPEPPLPGRREAREPPSVASPRQTPTSPTGPRRPSEGAEPPLPGRR